MASYNRNGVILWEGLSPINGKKVVCIATGLRNKSANKKTGNTIQTWILLADVKPTEAAINGDDKAICGDCPHRLRMHKEHGKKIRTCYVKTFHAPLAVWNCYKKNRYLTLDEYTGSTELIKSKKLRLGSYGDPSIVPYKTWIGLIGKISPLGYTHLWKENLVKVDPRMKDLVMASTDQESEVQQAEDLGYRVFHVGAKIKGLKHCPSDPSIEESKQVDCETCGACDGNFKRPNRSGRYINPHGAIASKYLRIAA